MRSAHRIFPLTLVALVAACGEDTPKIGAFTPADCPAQAPAGVSVRCGYVRVPEVHGQQDGRTIDLAVAIVRSTSPTPAPDPVVYLEGGPGGAALLHLPKIHLFADLLQTRDLVLVDQRGTGHSDPNLSCRSVVSNGDADPLGTCQAAHASRGIDLGAYDTAAIATDIDMVRQALGHATWNLFGVSYGTRVALTIMRDHSAGVRAAILDSIAPPQEDWLASEGPSLQRTFELMFQACASDQQCAAIYPDLRGRFFELVDSLNAVPIQIPVGDATTTFTGSDFVGVIRLLSYSESGLALAPELTWQVREQRYAVLSQILFNITQFYGSMSDGMHYSVMCQDVVPFTSVTKVDAANGAIHPSLRPVGDTKGYFDDCARWMVPASPAVEGQPVTSDRPALLLAGTFDPATPPAWATSTAATLSAGQLIEFSDMSHGVFTHPCAATIMNQFLANPQAPVDTSCRSPGAALAFSIPADRGATTGAIAAARHASSQPLQDVLEDLERLSRILGGRKP